MNAWKTVVVSRAKSGVWRLRMAVRRYGIAGTAKKSVQLMRSIPSRRRAASSAREFDQAFGLDTADIIRLDRLEIESPNRDYGNRYQAIDPSDFRELIGLLPIHHADYVFVDFGSGKGRALLLASELPFKRIVGVEFSAELNVIARRNITLFPRERQQCTTLEVVTMDAAEYELPLDPAVLYFYNPFLEPILKRVLARARESFVCQPRPIFIVFTGDSPLAPLFEEAGFVRLDCAGASQTRAIFSSPTATMSQD